jgi:hypothetical protein
MQREVGVQQEVLAPAELKTLLPAWAAADVGAATFEPESGHADGHLAATSMACRAADLGVTVRQGVAVTRIVVRAGRVMGVETADGILETHTLVLAAGAWSAALAQTAGVELPLEVMMLAVGVVERPPSMNALHPACIDTIQGIYFRPEGDNLTLLGDSRFEERDDPSVDPTSYPSEPPEDWRADAASRMTQRSSSWTGMPPPWTYSPSGPRALLKASPSNRSTSTPAHSEGPADSQAEGPGCARPDPEARRAGNQGVRRQRRPDPDGDPQGRGPGRHPAHTGGAGEDSEVIADSEHSETIYPQISQIAQISTNSEGLGNEPEAFVRWDL